MTQNLSEKLNGPISTSELERRWRALRERMTDAGIEVLLVQNNNDHMGGSVKYLTDHPATNGYPQAVIFPREDEMTVVRQGPFGGVVQIGAEGHPIWRGVGRVMTTPAFVTAPYTAAYHDALVVEALAPFSAATIGVVGMAAIPYGLLRHIETKYSRAKLVDATDLFDAIRAVRSPEELDLIRATARMQDRAMAAAIAAAQPGMRDSDVVAVALNACQLEGAEQGIFMTASGAPGSMMRMSPRHQQNRVLREGDQLSLLIETNGAGGFYTEIGRIILLGDVPPRVEDEFAFALEARQILLSGLAPGEASADVADEYNTFMEARGRPRDQRLVGHAQGYDMVERPLVRHDETMRIQRDMSIALHPTYNHDGAYAFVCDNYLVRESGRPERIHETAEVVFSAL